jgi:hypothetical protein
MTIPFIAFICPSYLTHHVSSHMLGTMVADLKTFLVAMALFQLAAALQVTPNSPCASFCLDGPDSDEADSQASTTDSSDISCKDDDFATKIQGRRYQRCMTCLQDSDFSEGDESDQQWFLCRSTTASSGLLNH